MIQVSMPAAFREVFGKGASRRLRMNDITPAVLYSGGDTTLSLQLDAGLLHKNLLEIHGRNAVIVLSIDGDEKGERHVLVKEIQKNPVTDRLIHVDFMEIGLDKPIDFPVPLKFKGTSKGVDLGGELHVAKKDVHLRACPLDVPDFIEVDISALDRGDRLAFGSISIPEKVEMLDSADAVCVYVN
jgi:large subunit ribosomal protein L25